MLDSLHEQWLYALRSPDGDLAGDRRELERFAQQIRQWRRPLDLGAPFRLTFQLDEPEAMSLRPRRIDIVQVRPGDTVAGFARRLPFEDFAIERFRVLNGLAADERLVAGRRIKIVVE